jgi:hypothetical protein
MEGHYLGGGRESRKSAPNSRAAFEDADLSVHQDKSADKIFGRTNPFSRTGISPPETHD